MASETPDVEVLGSEPEAAGSIKTPSAPASFTIETTKLAVDNGSENIDLTDVPISTTASLASSLYEHVEENGRTYHKYKEGKYFLPNDEEEQVRLDLQHHLCKYSLRGRLHLAPLSKDTLRNALDFGTGTGIWAIEFAEQYPNTQVIGSDLSPIQPEFIPANLSFEVDDMYDEWIYPEPFSYIHGRLLAFSFTGPPTDIFRKAYDALAPGGWFEMQDGVPLRSIDGSTAGTAMQKYYDLVVEACTKRGADVNSAERYKSMMKEVGFVDVKEVVVEWPIGTWAKSEFHKKLGALFHKDLSMGVEGIAMALFTRLLGMTKEEALEVVAGMKKDMDNNDIHGYQTFYVVYGRKPE